MSPRVLLLAAAVALCAPSAEARAFATKAELSGDINKCLTAVPSGVGCCALAAANCPTANDGGTTEMPDWDVSAITDFSILFRSRSSFDADISGWDVSSVTRMNKMFYGAAAFNQPIGDWDVSSVTNMYRMFSCLLYTSPSPRDGLLSRMPSSA